LTAGAFRTGLDVTNDIILWIFVARVKKRASEQARAA
jgi:hypothetical protein